MLAKAILEESTRAIRSEWHQSISHLLGEYSRLQNTSPARRDSRIASCTDVMFHCRRLMPLLLMWCAGVMSPAGRNATAVAWLQSSEQQSM